MQHEQSCHRYKPHPSCSVTEAEKRSGAPDFVIRAYLMASKCDSEVADWSDDGETFTIKNTAEFAEDEIPTYFEPCLNTVISPHSLVS